MARILVDMMNSMMSFLNFTVEVGDDFEDGKLPTLDLKVWIQDGVIEYEFYEEVVRRLLHTSRRLPDAKMLECLEKLCQFTSGRS